MSDKNAVVTDDIVNEYERNGAVLLRQLVKGGWADLIELGLERAIRNPSGLARDLFPGTDKAFYYDDYNYAVVPEWQILLRDSPIVDVVASILRTKELRLFYDQIFIKKGGQERRTPWHQDTPYWSCVGRQYCNLWITIDPLPTEESLEFVRGSHLGPLYAGGDFGEGVPQQPGPPLPDIDGQRDRFDILAFPIERGDVVMFHPSMLHGGGAVSAERRRRTLALKFFGDDVVYVRRPKPSPPFPGLAEVNKEGEALRSSWFPLLYPRPSQPVF